MSALLSIILSAVVPAAPIEANTWFTPQEYFKTSLAVGERGPLFYTIDVAQDGTAIRCNPATKTDLDARVCELIMKRARLTPAKDDQGRPAFALHEGVVNILMPGKPGRPERAKLIVTTDVLPAGVAAPAYARVAFLVDAGGTISQCASLPGESRRRLVVVESLGPAACTELAKDYRPVPARDAAGNAVPSVQNVMVRFETPKAP